MAARPQFAGYLSQDPMVVAKWNHLVWIDIKVYTDFANLATSLNFLISHMILCYAEKYIHTVLCYVALANCPNPSTLLITHTHPIRIDTGIISLWSGHLTLIAHRRESFNFQCYWTPQPQTFLYHKKLLGTENWKQK